MIRGRFIGIDRFLDPAAPDLSGCVRDATALYSVFQDGLPDISSELVCNEEATIERIQEVIRETLEEATEDDAVILTFATHGTHDHRIVAFNSDMHDLDGTTFHLNDLVDAFKKTRAKFVLIILDCCFAGAAPARVISDSPFARGIFDIQGIQGKGKLIISASRMDEAAYEHPVDRHGLLTSALVSALTKENAGVMAMVESVVAEVRTLAAGMGVTQNPTATTYIDGGFRLPTLLRGDIYRHYFPEYGGAQTIDINGIAAFGVPDDIVAAWSAEFNNHLHELQLDAINKFRVLDGRSLFVVAPTSSGKTFVGELAAISAILQGRKAVFLLPYKALVSEKFAEFSARYGDRLGLRVIRCNSDYRDDTQAFMAGKFDIAVLTYEMFLGLTVSKPAVLNLLGLVVLDEAQFIANPDRGIIVELILTFLRMNRARGIQPQLVLLSAVLGNVEQFGRWLNIDILVSTIRPVPLEFGVLDRQGTYQYLDADGQPAEIQLLPRGAVVQRRDKPSSQDVIVPLVRRLIQNDNERIIVFRNRRGETEGSSQYLAHELGLPPAEDALDALPTDDLSASSQLLRNALQGGVAFHDSNLNAAERALVETVFRDHNGGIRILTATSGVGAGINTPASTAIIVETVQPKTGNPPMSVGDVRNMAGRAGRFGYQETGRAIILAESPLDRARLFRSYVTAQPEAIRSSFELQDVPTWLLRLLRQVGRIPRAEVPMLLVNTFGGYLATLNNPDMAQQLEAQITNLLQRMTENGLLDESAGGVSLTLLGNACGLSSLQFESCLRLIELVRRLGVAGPLTPETMLGLLQALPEGDEMYVPIQRRGTAEGRWVAPFVARFGAPMANELRRFAADTVEMWAKFKRALIAIAWSDGVPIDQIERTYSVNPFYNRVGAGDVRGLADGARFRLRSVYDIVYAADPLLAPDPVLMDAFLARLEFGIPAEALFLLGMQVSFSRAESIAIVRAGITSIEGLDATSREELLRRLPLELVNKLKPLDV